MLGHRLVALHHLHHIRSYHQDYLANMPGVDTDAATDDALGCAILFINRENGPNHVIGVLECRLPPPRGFVLYTVHVKKFIQYCTVPVTERETETRDTILNSIVLSSTNFSSLLRHFRCAAGPIFQ